MTDTMAFPTAHVAPSEALRFPQPLREVPEAPKRTPAEEAKALVVSNTIGTLATLSDDGHPWASLVTYGVMPDGSPVICVSTLAEHGRNLVRDQRASIVAAQRSVEGDPLDAGRVTLAGRFRAPADEEELEVARAAVAVASPASAMYGKFGDFSYWILDVERVRWVGGFGRMDSATAEDYHACEADPVAPTSAYAVRHLNEDHADALLDIAQQLAGYDDATSAVCSRADRYGIDLTVETPRGTAYTRVGFAEPATTADGLRPATVELTKRARALAAGAPESV